MSIPAKASIDALEAAYPGFTHAPDVTRVRSCHTFSFLFFIVICSFHENRDVCYVGILVICWLCTLLFTFSRLITSLCFLSCGFKHFVFWNFLLFLIFYYLAVIFNNLRERVPASNFPFSINNYFLECFNSRWSYLIHIKVVLVHFQYPSCFLYSGKVRWLDRVAHCSWTFYLGFIDSIFLILYLYFLKNKFLLISVFLCFYEI